MPSMPVTIRVALVRCDSENFAQISDQMDKSERILRPGIEALPGLLAFYAGADAETLTLTNVSIWDSLEHAKQLDTFQPMVELARQFIAEGGRPERPVMNHEMQWSFGAQALAT
jgi:hypothetical protein